MVKGVVVQFLNSPLSTLPHIGAEPIWRRVDKGEFRNWTKGVGNEDCLDIALHKAKFWANISMC